MLPYAVYRTDPNSEDRSHLDCAPYRNVTINPGLTCARLIERFVVGDWSTIPLEDSFVKHRSMR